MHAMSLIKDCQTIDAFVGPNAEGNPAGVLVLDEPLSDDEMKHIARAMGHSETAFLLRKGPGRYGLRWFHPESEARLCGHATLASAWFLWNRRGTTDPTLSFDTLSGRLVANRIGDQIELDFPQDFPTAWVPTRSVLDALGIHRFVKAAISPTTGKTLIELANAAEVAGLLPDFAALRAALPDAKGGLIVTARGDDGFDFHSRFFHPWVGVDEDPVTGSAHCLLATYWSRILGKDQMTAYQSSKRGGVLEVELASKERVKIRGQARIRP